MDDNGAGTVTSYLPRYLLSLRQLPAVSKIHRPGLSNYLERQKRERKKSGKRPMSTLTRKCVPCHSGVVGSYMERLVSSYNVQLLILFNYPSRPIPRVGGPRTRSCTSSFTPPSLLATPRMPASTSPRAAARSAS